MKLEEIEIQKQRINKALGIKSSLDNINYTLGKIKETNTNYGLIDVQIGSIGAVGIKASKEVVLELLLKEKERLEKELEEI